MDQNTYDAAPALEKSPLCDCDCRAQGLTPYSDDPARESGGRRPLQIRIHPSSIRRQYSTSSTTKELKLRDYILYGITIFVICALMVYRCLSVSGVSAFHFVTPGTLNVSPASFAAATAPQQSSSSDSTWTLDSCTGDAFAGAYGATTSECLHNDTAPFMSYGFYEQPPQNSWIVCRYSTSDCTGTSFRTGQTGCTSLAWQSIMSLQVIPATQQCPQ